jgi:hypothetical protein
VRGDVHLHQSLGVQAVAVGWQGMAGGWVLLVVGMGGMCTSASQVMCLDSRLLASKALQVGGWDGWWVVCPPAPVPLIHLGSQAVAVGWHCGHGGWWAEPAQQGI